MKKIYLLFTFVFLLISTSAYSQYTTLLNFEGITNGSFPGSALISDGNFLYGMTEIGGSNNYGTIFKILPDGTSYEKLLDFEGTTNGSFPLGVPIYDGTFLYGMTLQGGTNEKGTIFKIMPDGTGNVKLLDFVGSNGSLPYGSLVSDGTYLYGMTNKGGINDLGTIFKITTNGTGYVKLLDFAGTSSGSSPYGSLLFEDSFLYGMTRQGGTTNGGTIFKIMPDGTGYVKLLDFSGGSDGYYPIGSLISDGVYLYGMTQFGGVNNLGTIFRIKKDGTDYIKLIDFAGSASGSYPGGSLVSEGSFLYGMTEYGGANNKGTIFKILPDGTGYVKLWDFAVLNSGPNHIGSLISDGTFLYGMTVWGGSNNIGSVFKFHPTSLGVEEKNSITINLNPNPTTGIINISSSIKGVQLVSITNILGEEVISKNINLDLGIPLTFDLTEQKAGIYFIRIGNSTERIIKF